MTQSEANGILNDIRNANKNVMDVNTRYNLRQYLEKYNIDYNALMLYAVDTYMKKKRGKEANAYRKDVTKADIISFREKGYTIKDIAALYGVSEKTIRNRLA